MNATYDAFIPNHISTICYSNIYLDFKKSHNSEGKWGPKFVFNHWLKASGQGSAILCKQRIRGLFNRDSWDPKIRSSLAVRIRRTFSWNLTVLMLSNTFSKWACIVCVSDACPRISRRAGSETKKNRGKQSRFFSKYLRGERKDKPHNHT